LVLFCYFLLFSVVFWFLEAYLVAVKIFLWSLGLGIVCVLGSVFGFDCCFRLCLTCVMRTFNVAKRDSLGNFCVLFLGWRNLNPMRSGYGSRENRLFMLIPVGSVVLFCLLWIVLLRGFLRCHRRLSFGAR